MASIPQISASLISPTNQNTLGLANFTIELALVEVVAPAEYAGLGTALSQKRRGNAENGFLHQIAGKLVLLFEQLVPPIPDLIKAYGSRVSEIASALNKYLTSEPMYGPLAGYVGVNGTFIYAAAASGSSALAVYISACMLARSFTAPEATAIWVELVVERKKELGIVASSRASSHAQSSNKKLIDPSWQLGMQVPELG